MDDLVSLLLDEIDQLECKKHKLPQESLPGTVDTIPLSSLALRPRTRRLLQANGFFYLHHIKQLTRTDLLALEGITPAAVDEILNVLDKAIGQSPTSSAAATIETTSPLKPLSMQALSSIDEQLLALALVLGAEQGCFVNLPMLRRFALREEISLGHPSDILYGLANHGVVTNRNHLWLRLESAHVLDIRGSTLPNQVADLSLIRERLRSEGVLVPFHNSKPFPPVSIIA